MPITVTDILGADIGADKLSTQNKFSWKKALSQTENYQRFSATRCCRWEHQNSLIIYALIFPSLLFGNSNEDVLDSNLSVARYF